MKKFKNITIVGTNHISKESIKKITSVFDKEKPDIVCIELDKGRYSSLLSNKKSSYNPSMISKIGLKGYLFAVIGGIIQKTLGKKTGMKPGIDMRTAIKLAKKNNSKIMLIDQPIQKTLWNISHKISKQDKKNFWSDLWYGLVISITGQKLFRKLLKNKANRIIMRLSVYSNESFNINSIPKEDLIERLMEKLEIIYPSLYKILIVDRNRFMSTNLHNIMLKEPDKKIVAIVGAGHTPGMIKLLENYDKKVIIN